MSFHTGFCLLKQYHFNLILVLKVIVESLRLKRKKINLHQDFLSRGNEK